MSAIRAFGLLRRAGPAQTLRASAPLGIRRLMSSEPPSKNEQFISGTGARYADAMYDEWKRDPNAVHASWRAFFEGESRGLGKGATYTPPPAFLASASAAVPYQGSGGNNAEVLIEHLARAYEMRGHNIAKLDPLGINNADLDDTVPQELTLAMYGLSEDDLTRKMPAPALPIFEAGKEMPLGDILQHLQTVFCNHVGFEYMFISEYETIAWMRNKVAAMQNPLDEDSKRLLMQDLIDARTFELFLQKKFVAEKRFGVDGCESLIAGMRAMLRRASDLDVSYAVLGMPHRGRLNVLANVMNKPIEAILNEFNSNLGPHDEGSGDVKYHLGMSSDITFEHNKRSMHLSLMANPSHLEAVNPVVTGKARAEQDLRKDTERKKVVPILLHGDAAFAGQGVVYETLGMSQLPAYKTGGTIHIVVNNQIGFTTDPRFSRSTPYSTDVAKMVNAPVFHVNGDDAEAVVRCCNAAMEYRQEFGKDVVVDIVCYRRFGHNEADQPSFTQPKMYKKIDVQPPVDEIYAAELKEQSIVDDEWLSKSRDETMEKMDLAYENAPKYKKSLVSKQLGGWWKKMDPSVYGRTPNDQVPIAEVSTTGVDLDRLRDIGVKFATVPDDFVLHKQLIRNNASRMKSITTGQGIDWATGEALAFGSMLMENKIVRLSGQDVERGTFSQRHHVVHDQEQDGVTYNALQHLSDDQADYTVTNSHLSEYAVLGFELGYAQTTPDALVIWEAQFGDFCNTAQCIIDQFIVSMEHKWRHMSGLVMLLPHGYEGMGPEHSSGRLERFLQLVNDDEDVMPVMQKEKRRQIQDCNLQVVNCTTPANYFHVLRRQLERPFRKPLVVMTPKSLLRFQGCKSDLEEFGPGTRFKRFIGEQNESIANSDNVKRLVLCSGKVYYDLLKYREENDITDVAIGRVEQISPFPFDLVQRFVGQHPNAEVVWCQEEPKNAGAWFYVNPRIETALINMETEVEYPRARYVGRAPSSSVATGDKTAHKHETEQFISAAFRFD